MARILSNSGTRQGWPTVPGRQENAALCTLLAPGSRTLGHTIPTCHHQRQTSDVPGDQGTGRAWKVGSEDSQSPKVQGLKPREDGCEVRASDNRVVADSRNSWVTGFCQTWHRMMPMGLSTFRRRTQEHKSKALSTQQHTHYLPEGHKPSVCPLPHPP